MKLRSIVIAIGTALALTDWLFGQYAVFSDDFEADAAAIWTVNNGPSDEAHDFFFDYSTVGIPPAPFRPGTHGMKLQANQANGIFSGMSVSPFGKRFIAPYQLRFDWWANVNGPFPVGGSGSTQLSTFGIGTSGTVAQWPGGTQDSIWFGATGEGQSPSDWRAYSTTVPSGYPSSAPGIYAAGNTDANDPYYAGFGGKTAPAAQAALFPQQTGTTVVGSAGMEWHQVEIQNDNASVTWKVDGKLIASVPIADVAIGGTNIFFGHADTNATSSTDPNDTALLFTLIDNVRVLTEPGLPIFGLGTFYYGDMNFDLRVDGADYVSWRKHHSDDYDAFADWRYNFGAVFELELDEAATAPVPEPASLLVLMFGAAVSLFLRRNGQLC